MKTIVGSILVFCSLAGYAQLLDEHEYTKEFTWGVNKNTNSGLIGGIVLKYGRLKNDNIFEIFGLEFLNVRHPKEYRRPTQSGTYFVWGKENYLYSIRMLYGREILMFKKASQQGVQISAIYGGGPTLGVIAPYYVLTASGEYKKFDQDDYSKPYEIQGSGKLFQGIGQSDLTAGLNAKAGLSFEFGAFKNNAAGVEIGVAGEAFPQKIILLPEQKNRAVFTSMYFSLYWGTRR